MIRAIASSPRFHGQNELENVTVVHPRPEASLVGEIEA
jgi:hypothetical protein